MDGPVVITILLSKLFQKSSVFHLETGIVFDNLENLIGTVENLCKDTQGCNNWKYSYLYTRKNNNK